MKMQMYVRDKMLKNYKINTRFHLGNSITEDSRSKS